MFFFRKLKYWIHALTFGRLMKALSIDKVYHQRTVAILPWWHFAQFMYFICIIMQIHPLLELPWWAHLIPGGIGVLFTVVYFTFCLRNVNNSLRTYIINKRTNYHKQYFKI